MGLDDFEKLDSGSVERSNDEQDVFFKNFHMEDVGYYLLNMNELLNLVKDSHYEYINAKLEYDFKKDKLQTSIKWDEENALRKNNGLPKISNKEQREAVVNLKCKPLHIKMKNCELKYKNYNKLLTFITNNFESLVNMSEISFVGEKVLKEEDRD